jgi:hypothetical protein
MSLTDPLENAFDALQEESELRGEWESVVVLLSTIPFASGPISALLAGKAHRRLAERVKEVLSELKQRYESDQDKVDKKFFDTEEFQTIFFLTMGQLQTTHDKEKLKSLANALTNSGLLEFSSDDRKELFLSILRNLSPQHVCQLKSMRPMSRMPASSMPPVLKNPSGEERAILQSLVAQGLVDLDLDSASVRSPRFSNISTEAQAERIFREVSERVPDQCYVINEFGMAFLKFISDSATS